MAGPDHCAGYLPDERNNGFIDLLPPTNFTSSSIPMKRIYLVLVGFLIQSCDVMPASVFTMKSLTTIILTDVCMVSYIDQISSPSVTHHVAA